MHAEWRQARIARQREIDASIAAKAEFEYLYDKPYPDNARIRVAGPFTVESLSPHRVVAVDQEPRGSTQKRRLADALKSSLSKSPLADPAVISESKLI